jgi:NAD(P)-dependent dehydrogenase (short-subunit alcohol dehydrogenase family)
MKSVQAARGVIVTGGSGALGRAVLTRFLAAGDRIVVPWIVRREHDAIQAEESAAVAEGRIVLVEADVAEDAGARAVVAAMPGAEILVNGVGGFAGGSPLHETELEVWDRMLRMNLRTAVAMSRAALPGMLARRRGVIVNIASRAAIDRPAGLAAYAASKSAVVSLTESLQREVHAHGVRVNAIVPTTIDTPANREAMPDADFALWTPPARIADVIHFLASDEGATLRGSLVPV